MSPKILRDEAASVSEEKKADFFVRKYEPRDREAVRWLCCETGFLGSPIDPVFEDRELFADFLTSYYTDIEPESAFVLEHDGKVKGYLLGSRRPFLHQFYSFCLNVVLLARVVWRYRRYKRSTRDFIGWILRNSWREVPAAPRRVAHFHFNLLPEVQGIGGGRLLLRRYLEYLLQCGEKRVYGQLVTFEGRRGSRLFERYGFKVLSKREITKFRRFHPEPVYLTTVIKELEDGKSI
ncbi:MAG: GNAT family N-acetyltransferase [Chthoniobacterales bacterium]|nr:GNAT family N-acetyltransferase [Chthoniobacterales bacterium]